jgi:hypothetical protein
VRPWHVARGERASNILDMKNGNRPFVVQLNPMQRAWVYESAALLHLTPGERLRQLVDAALRPIPGWSPRTVSAPSHTQRKP